MENDKFDTGGTRAWRANQLTWITPQPAPIRAARRWDWPFGSFVASVVIFATLLRASAFLGAAFVWVMLIGTLVVLAIFDAVKAALFG